MSEPSPILDPTAALKVNALLSMVHNMVRLWRMVWRERKGILLVLGAVIIGASALPFLRSGASALLINYLVANASSGLVAGELYVYITFLVAVEVLSPLVYSLQWYFDKLFNFSIQELLSLKVYGKFARADIAYHEDPSVQNMLIKIIESGTWKVEAFIGRQFYIWQNVFEVLIASSILASIDWWMFLVVLIGTVPEMFVEVKYGKEVWGLYTAGAETRRRYWSLTRMTDQMKSLIELKLFRNVDLILSLIQKLYVEFNVLQRKAERTKLWAQLSAILVSQATVAFATIWFVLSVVEGSIEVGTLVFLLASVGSLRQALSGFFGNIGKQYQDNLFVSDVFQLLDALPVVPPPADPKPIPPDVTPEIVFDHVSFSYPGSDTRVLDDVSLTIPSGTKLAIVGLNGAGKTTLVKLLARFYDPTEGSITVGGVDLKDIDLDIWYRLVGALFQEYAAYDSFTVGETIAMGDTERPYNEEAAITAAKECDAHDFISAWKNGYRTILGKSFKGGEEASVGQWQKLALARVFYRQPRVWILDEPTASIDAQAEAKIFEKLAELPTDRTVILISHRFSTVRHADHIIVLEQGKIIEHGSHDELLSQGGKYATLFHLQAKGYK